MPSVTDFWNDAVPSVTDFWNDAVPSVPSVTRCGGISVISILTVVDCGTCDVLRAHGASGKNVGWSLTTAFCLTFSLYKKYLSRLEHIRVCGGAGVLVVERHV